MHTMTPITPNISMIRGTYLYENVSQAYIHLVLYKAISNALRTTRPPKVAMVASPCRAIESIKKP